MRWDPLDRDIPPLEEQVPRRWGHLLLLPASLVSNAKNCKNRELTEAAMQELSRWTWNHPGQDSGPFQQLPVVNI